MRLSLLQWSAARATLCALLLLGSACQGPDVSSEDPPQLFPGGTGEVTAEAPSKDRSVEQHLAQFIRATHVVDGRRLVEIDLVNQADASVAFSFHVEWLDREGEVVVDREASWTGVVLAPGERLPLKLTAPHPMAESWRLIAVAPRDV